MNLAGKFRRHQDRELNTHQIFCSALIAVNGLLLGTGGAIAVNTSFLSRLIFFGILSISSLTGIGLMIHAIYSFIMIERNNARYYYWADNTPERKENDHNSRQNKKRIEYQTHRCGIIEREYAITIFTIAINSICIITLVFIN